MARRLPGWLSADAVAIGVFKLPTNASVVPHVRVTRGPCGVHGHSGLVNELTVPLSMSLALRFFRLEITYEHEQYCEYNRWGDKDLQGCLARQLRYQRLD
jgi:hypothetical protein